MRSASRSAQHPRNALPSSLRSKARSAPAASTLQRLPALCSLTPSVWPLAPVVHSVDSPKSEPVEKSKSTAEGFDAFLQTVLDDVSSKYVLPIHQPFASRALQETLDPPILTLPSINPTHRAHSARLSASPFPQNEIRERTSPVHFDRPFTPESLRPKAVPPPSLSDLGSVGIRGSTPPLSSFRSPLTISASSSLRFHASATDLSLFSNSSTHINAEEDEELVQSKVLHDSRMLQPRARGGTDVLVPAGVRRTRSLSPSPRMHERRNKPASDKRSNLNVSMTAQLEVFLRHTRCLIN